MTAGARGCCAVRTVGLDVERPRGRVDASVTGAVEEREAVPALGLV